MKQSVAFLPAEGNASSVRKNIFSRISQRITKRNTIIEIICTLLVVLFVYTGMNKLLDYSVFHAQLKQSPFIKPMAGFIAATLPAGELILSLLLILKRTRLLGLYLSFFLMLTFTGYIYAMLHYSYYLPCSCGGILAKMSWNDHLVFNSIFTALAATGVLLQVKQNKIGSKNS